MKADTLAKQGSSMQQNTTETTLEEAKTNIKAEVRTKWIKQHPSFSIHDQYLSLNREEQTIIFQFIARHNRLRKHMYTKLKIGKASICPCGQGPQSAEDILQTSPNVATLRHSFRPEPTTFTEKIHGKVLRKA
ncbi:hypothetical protein PoB_007378400 [Plakobranchus ocellatus]|uniref:Uncharacterized protein n=1 Tax=Plakobranchus ocellatus TaxID=259542 RepID=A0AAV4DTF6_9GAST|nr:hypothetical protein PoB_007378400 [Plakobranchus ocellatus]